MEFNFLEIYNIYKDFINEAWSSMSTEDTEDDVEQEITDDLTLNQRLYKKFLDIIEEIMYECIYNEESLSNGEEESSLRDEDAQNFLMNGGLASLTNLKTGKIKDIDLKDKQQREKTLLNLYKYPETYQLELDLTYKYNNFFDSLTPLIDYNKKEDKFRILDM